MQKRRLILFGKLAVLMVGWVGIFLLSLMSGPVEMSIKEVVDVIFGDVAGPERSIVFQVRLPRAILGLAVGGTLSVAGVLLQGLFRNPLVEPYTLGISGGALVGVCLALILGLPEYLKIFTLPIFGFFGSILVVFLLYFLSVKRGVIKIHGLLLTGVMISFISSSIIMLIMAISRVEDLHGIVFWTMGFLGESNWNIVGVMSIVSIVGVVLAYRFCFDLNAFSLGEEEALHLGVDIEKTKRLVFVLASVMVGVSVSVVGIIGFVGLIIPHLVRMFIGLDHRILIGSSFLVGGIFLGACDAISRIIITPLELPVGVITGIVGGILFIYALTRSEVVLGKI